MTGLLPCTRQRCQTAGVDELQPSQIDDDLALAARDRRERSHDSRGVCHVKLPAQRHDNPAVAFAGTQIQANHKGTPPAPAARRGLDPTANSPTFTVNTTPDAGGCPPWAMPTRYGHPGSRG